MRGDESTDGDHVHEGLRLADGSGWVGIGDTNINGESNKPTQVKVTKIQSIFSFLSKKSRHGTPTRPAIICEIGLDWLC